MKAVKGKREKETKKKSTEKFKTNEKDERSSKKN